MAKGEQCKRIWSNTKPFIFNLPNSWFTRGWTIFAPLGFVLAVNENLKKRGVPGVFSMSLYKLIYCRCFISRLSLLMKREGVTSYGDMEWSCSHSKEPIWWPHKRIQWSWKTMISLHPRIVVLSLSWVNGHPLKMELSRPYRNLFITLSFVNFYTNEKSFCLEKKELLPIFYHPWEGHKCFYFSSKRILH